MKIVICGSMTFSPEMIEIGRKLKELGHEPILPPFAKYYIHLSREEMHSESAKNKIKHDLIREYYYKIRDSDAVLIVNEKRKNIENYIGGNTFLEIGFAHVLDKKIYLINPVPKIDYADEIKAMKPIILNEDLTKINERGGCFYNDMD